MTRSALVCAVVLASFAGAAGAQIVGRTAVPSAAVDATGAAGPAIASPPPLAGAPANPFLGSVPSQPLEREPIPLTLADALDRGLAHNLGVIAVAHQLDSAHAARWRSYGGVLPNLQGRLSDARQTVNLEAFGFEFPSVPGFDFPTLIGPFDVVDGRVALTQPLIDVAAWNDVRRSGHNLDAVELDSRNAREVVVLVVVEAYLRAVAGVSRVEVANIQVQTADALLKLATDQRNAGVVSGIDVLRAQVQLESQHQRLIAAETALAKDKIALVRAIGLPAAQDVTLVDRASDTVPPAPTVDDAIAGALASRPDYQALLERVKAAQADHRSARASWLPSLHLSADVGEIGQTVDGAERTYTVAGLLRVPLFDSGRTHSRVLDTEATLLQREAEAADFEQRVEAEVRTAFLDLQATVRQLEVARSLVDLADRELAQARTRFSAGVTNNLEVIDAQQSVANASDSLILSLHAYNLARVALGRASGTAEATAGALLTMH